MSKRKLEVGIMPVMGDGEGIVSEGIVQRAKPKWEWPFGMEEGGLGQRMGGEEEDDEREITVSEQLYTALTAGLVLLSYCEIYTSTRRVLT